MEIDINQNNISLGDKYLIFINGRKTHSASTQLISWLSEINLFEGERAEPKFVIKKNQTFFKISFDLVKWDTTVFEFRTKSYWKNHYFCQVGQDLYDIFGHHGRKYSVYKNDKQIAWWDKEAVTWFNGDNYKIIADKDCDCELLMAFCLIIDNTQSRDNGRNAVTIDLGNIGSQAREFDSNWRPK